MNYYQQIANGNMVQVVAADSVERCINYYGGEWVEIKAPPYIGYMEDGNYRPFPFTQPSHCLLSVYDPLLSEWTVIL
jgi:hypothetical protein